MPRVRHMDNSARHADEVRWIAPPSLPMCEHAQVLNSGTGRENTKWRLETRDKARPATARSEWPFLYSYRGNHCVVNAAPRKSAYAQAQEIGEALV